MEFDEAEWVIATAGAEDATAGADEEWIIEDGCGEDDANTDERRRSISGILFPTVSAGIGFAPFSPSTGNLSLSFLPPSLAVVAASNGLVLLRGPWSSYYLCNPLISEVSRIPRPARPHTRDATALVFSANPMSQFHLVCAVYIQGMYQFETYSSGSALWRSSIQEIPCSGEIMPSSAVSACGKAYWRTTDGVIVGFDPVIGDSRVIERPDGIGSSARWQLGEAGDRLCCVVVQASSVEIHVYEASNGWTLVGSIAVVSPEKEEEDGEEEEEEDWVIGGTIVCRETPWPLRFQSADPQAVLWVDGRVLAVDLASWRVRAVRIDGAAPDASIDDYVAHINTVASVQAESSRPISDFGSSLTLSLSLD
ncbi:hypothetical protein IHE45_02G013500 [Dioscorea alata]|uniref:Uncharacterized protein n=1 Tax=Dioscorea alata TaxID=55571 RepID=A0ACB7WP19_DIOAL|nr:hypothetical protein IHE45_02G013500 [Dioscorea alata]